MGNQPVLDLTSRDWETNLETLREYVRQRAPLTWNSFFSGDIGQILLEVIAYDHTILSYITDFQAREAFWGTFTLRESAQNFASLVGYKIRRTRPASLHVNLLTSSLPTSPEFYRVRKGQKVIAQDGQVWEVAADYTVEPGFTYPRRQILAYGDLRGVDYTQQPQAERDALIKINTGDSYATLVHPSGARLSTDVNFGRQISPGFVLKLGARLVAQSYFTGVPQQSEREFAVIEVGKLSTDAVTGSVLYLDRPWTSETFIGKWSIEDRGIVLTQKETFQESFTAPSNNTANLEVKCNFHPVIDSGDSSGVVVFVNGERWLETDSMLLAASSDKVYEVSFDENDKAILKFGDGTYGALIKPDSIITLEYSIGGGTKGNVQPGSFSATLALESSVASTDVSSYLSNPYTSGTGGQNQESIDDIRRGILRTVKTANRAVGSDDFESLALSFYDGQSGTVLIAKASLRSNSVPQENNVVWVHIWTSGTSGFPVQPSFLLKQRLQSYLSSKAMVGTEVVVLDGLVRHIPVIVKFKYSGSVELAKEAVKLKLYDLLLTDGSRTSLQLGSLYDSVKEASGIDYVKFISPIDDIKISDDEVITNTLDEGGFTVLATQLQRGSSNIPVGDPSLFTNGGVVTITEAGRIPTTSFIESIGGGVLTLREGICLDDYTTSARVYNTDYIPIVWEVNKPVIVFINIDYGGNQDRIKQQLKFRIELFFGQHLLPGQELKLADINSIVASTPGVLSLMCHFDRPGNQVQSITCLANELITVKEIIINGQKL